MATGRSPRSATHLVHHLESHHFLKPSVEVPKKDVQLLSEYLWSQTTKYQEAALQSEYVQGLKNASLNPEGFGKVLLCFIFLKEKYIPFKLRFMFKSVTFFYSFKLKRTLSDLTIDQRFLNRQMSHLLRRSTMSVT